MKKLLLVSAALLGAASISQAGISFNIGIGLPPLPLPGLIISRPAPVCDPAPVVSVPRACEPAPVVTAPAVCAPAQVITSAPACERPTVVFTPPPVVVAPRPLIVAPPVYNHARYAYGPYRGEHAVYGPFEHGRRQVEYRAWR